MKDHPYQRRVMAAIGRLEAAADRAGQDRQAAFERARRLFLDSEHCFAAALEIEARRLSELQPAAVG